MPIAAAVSGLERAIAVEGCCCVGSGVVVCEACVRLVCALRVCLFFARVAVETISREASNDLCTLPPLKGRHKGREFLTIVPLLPPSWPFLQPWRPLPARRCKSPLAKSNLCDFQIRRPRSISTVLVVENRNEIMGSFCDR